MSDETVEPAFGSREHLLRLREPFPASAIGKLPRAGVELDFVGHAAVTDRLLQVDPVWSWEPCAYEDGLPKVTHRDTDAVLWIRLTVCGLSRLGVGIVKANAFELEKQLISDALRNAAMRFGVALDLWTRQDLHDAPPDLITAGQASEILARLDVLGQYPERWQQENLPNRKNMAYMTVSDHAVALAILDEAEQVVGAGGLSEAPASEGSGTAVAPDADSPAPADDPALLEFSDEAM